jgi:chromosome segregation ATPase
MLRSELEQARSDVFLLQEQLSLRERKEGGLRAELERVQASSSRDLISLQETIKANHRAMELQDEDMARLRKAKDEARVEVRRLQSSLAETQQELEILRNRYGDLQQQYSRLDALVRGRKKA